MYKEIYLSPLLSFSLSSINLSLGSPYTEKFYFAASVLNIYIHMIINYFSYCEEQIGNNRNYENKVYTYMFINI